MMGGIPGSRVTWERGRRVWWVSVVLILWFPSGALVIVAWQRHEEHALPDFAGFHYVACILFWRRWTANDGSHLGYGCYVQKMGV